ncbi:MAG: folate-binding protein [Xanthomonadaceae bacterium]|nr:folate-binding protein [Xanthomonadaceae bacterium]
MPNPLHAETLILHGPDAGAFAHAQFSSKVDALAVGQWQFSAWLDPHGRVCALFHLARLEDQRYLLMLRGGDAAALAAALQRFVFRSKVVVTALAPGPLASGPAIPLHRVLQEQGVVMVGCGDHSLQLSASGSGDDAWRLPQLHAGWPWLNSAAACKFHPAALSLQRLGAVAVDKGCYPGQEIVARLHFRGGDKRHLHRGGLSPAAAIGDALRVEGIEVGHVLDSMHSSRGNEALVILSDDIAKQARAGISLAFDHHLALELEASWPA